MARKFLEFKKYEKKLETLFSSSNGEKAQQVLHTIRGNRDNIAFAMASRLVRAHADAFGKFKSLLADCVTEQKLEVSALLKGSPLIVLGPTEDTLRVFPNLTLDNIEPDDLAYVSYTMHWDALDTFMNIYRTDMADAGKAKGWATASRTWKRIKRHEDMPIARVLSRYTKLSEKADHVVRDIATGILEMRRPLEIKYAEKPEDFVEMYGSGPQSCMSHNGSQADRTWSFLIDELGVHPTSFFAFHPYTKGAYVKAGGKVMCRSILYEVKNGVWEHGRVYFANNKYMTLFMNALKERGVHELKEGRFNRKAEFKVSGIEHKKLGSIVPIPYFDNLNQNIQVKYDKNKKEFTINVGGNTTSNYQTYVSGGYIASTNMEIVKCACGKEHKNGTRLISSHDGNYKFCGTHACFAKVGYCQAYRSDGGHIVIPIADAVPDVVNKGAYYLNMDAAIKMRCLPALASFNYIPEEDEAGVTNTYDRVINVNGNKYAWTGGNAMFNDYWNARMNSSRDHLQYHGETHNSITVYELFSASGAMKVNIKRQKVVIIDDNEVLIAA